LNVLNISAEFQVLRSTRTLTSDFNKATRKRWKIRESTTVHSVQESSSSGYLSMSRGSLKKRPYTVKQ